MRGELGLRQLLLLQLHVRQLRLFELQLINNGESLTLKGKALTKKGGSLTQKVRPVSPPRFPLPRSSGFPGEDFLGRPPRLETVRPLRI